MKFHLVVVMLLLSGFLLPLHNSSAAQPYAEKLPLSKILEKENILDMSYLKSTDARILCIATSYVKEVSGSPFPFWKLIFYRQTGNVFTKVHEFEPGFRFSGFQVLDNSDLMTLWTGVNAM
jgi:hypothetical protein